MHPNHSFPQVKLSVFFLFLSLSHLSRPLSLFSLIFLCLSSSFIHHLSSFSLSLFFFLTFFSYDTCLLFSSFYTFLLLLSYFSFPSLWLFYYISVFLLCLLFPLALFSLSTIFIVSLIFPYDFPTRLCSCHPLLFLSPSLPYIFVLNSLLRPFFLLIACHHNSLPSSLNLSVISSLHGGAEGDKERGKETRRGRGEELCIRVEGEGGRGGR